MKAIAYQDSLPVEDPASLQDVELPEPVVRPHDLLVEVRAVSVNPVDAKVRMRARPEPGRWKVLGWDACGIVKVIGSEVRSFRPGDRVWYAGELQRDGCNSERHVVDERLAGHAPRSLGDAGAAAIPLTLLTAWELLFDRMGIPAGGESRTGRSLLVVGAGGGVGSVMTQLARRLAGLTVIGTASRAQTRDWVLGLGADAVIDHGKPLAGQFADQGLAAPDYVVSLTKTDTHFAQIAELIAPQGRLGLVDDPDPAAIDIGLLKRKSVSLHWEFMFTRSLFATEDRARQREILEKAAALVDSGVLRTTVGESLGRIDAANLRRAHARLESGQACGKLVLEGF